MKVLKEGRKQTGWANECVCSGKGYGGGGCGATLLVEESDLHYSSTGYGGDTNEFIWFKCPSCGVATDIEVPPGVMQRVRDRVSKV
jgi:hypothetical protein